MENGNVNNLEEGIIVFATMIRGLKYTKTEKDKKGNIKIVLKDINLEEIVEKKK